MATKPRQGPNRLSSIEIDSLFRHGNDVQLAMSSGGESAEDQRMQILFDNNGAGKTTLLRCVYHMLSWAELDSHLAALAELPIEGATLRLGSSKVEFKRSTDDPRACSLSVEGPNGSAEVAYEIGREDPRFPDRSRLVLDRQEVRAFKDVMAATSPPPVFVGDDRVIRGDDLFPSRSRARERVRPPTYGLAYTADVPRAPREPSSELRGVLDSLAQGFLRQAFAAGVPAHEEGVYAAVVQRIADHDLAYDMPDIAPLLNRTREIHNALLLAENYGLITLSQLRAVQSTLNGLRWNARNKNTIATVLDPYFTTLEADTARLDPVAQQIELFVSTTNSFLSDKRLTFEPQTGLQIQTGQPGDRSSIQLETDQLSSGERHLLLLLGAAMMAPGPRLMIIDEPELSLGIEWKRSLLRALLNLTKNSQVQFLVASHSVEIISPLRHRAIRLSSDPT